MKKTVFILLICFLGFQTAVCGQARYFTKQGHISFFSEAPLENIEAHNEQVVSFIDMSTGDLVFSVTMKAFQFRKSLMQEHFNENFIESDTYPKATFKGRVMNIKAIELSGNHTYKVNITGVLTIHGVDKQIDTEGVLAIQDNKIQGKSTFTVTPQEFNIEIPLLVREHIAKRIDITVDMLYEPFTSPAQ